MKKLQIRTIGPFLQLLVVGKIFQQTLRKKMEKMILFKIAFSSIILLLFYLDIKICFVKSMCVLTLRLTLKIFDGGVI